MQLYLEKIFMRANKSDAPNPAKAPRFQVGSRRRGVGDPLRYAQ
jgi:hypothetical protein